MIVYLDGAWLDDAAASISIADRGFLYGDSVFDTARLVDGRYFRLRDHLRRLRAGAAMLRIPLPPDEELCAVAEELRDRNAARDAMLRLTLTRGTGGRDVGTPGAGPPTLLATLAPLPPDWQAVARRGWDVITAEVRHPPPSVMPPGFKGPGRVFSLLARLEAEAAGVDDALLLSVTGVVTEGSRWNVFWRTGDLVRTPALDVGILGGVTREVVLELARREGLRTEQGGWPRAELDAAEEAWATMSSRGVVPIRRLDGRTLRPARPAAPRLFDAYWRLVRAEIAAA